MAMRSKSFVYAITVVIILGVLSSVFSAGAAADVGWGTAQVIETDDSASAESPQVSMDSSGNAFAVWNRGDHIWSNRYVVGMNWGAAELIETDNLGEAGSPQVLADSSGNAIAVWSQHVGDHFSLQNIWSNRYVAGTGWGTAHLIETNDSGSASNVQVSADSSGNAIAVWSQSDGDFDYSIWSNRYVVGTGWGTAQLIETED
jgi:hypothetical protein